MRPFLCPILRYSEDFLGIVQLASINYLPLILRTDMFMHAFQDLHNYNMH